MLFIKEHSKMVWGMERENNTIQMGIIIKGTFLMIFHMVKKANIPVWMDLYTLGNFIKDLDMELVGSFFLTILYMKGIFDEI